MSVDKGEVTINLRLPKWESLADSNEESILIQALQGLSKSFSFAEILGNRESILVLELLKALSPDLLIIICIPSDPEKAEVVYIHSRFTTELPANKISAFLEKEWQHRKKTKTFWSRILREDVWASQEENPIGIFQQIGDLHFSITIDKVGNIQQGSVFLILKGTEATGSTQQLQNEIWKIVTAFEVLDHQYRQLQLTTANEEMIWQENWNEAIKYFLTFLESVLYPLYRSGQVDMTKINTAREMMERLRTLLEAKPASGV
ncbi:MAG TPA: hypothetical protein VF209_05035 [Patescibacteria group bacterium]